MDKFPFGAVVRLVSGGPKMTVAFPSRENTGNIVCLWFTKHGDLREGEFPQASLIAVLPSGETPPSAADPS